MFLPPEIVFHVFSYLDSTSLLVASAISRLWRGRALDPRLWRRLYIYEGWAAEYREIRKFESEPPTPPTPTMDSDRKARMTRTAADGSGDEQRTRRKIARNGFPLEGNSMHAFEASPPTASATLGLLDTMGWREQHGGIEADESPGQQPPTRLGSETQDAEMTDAQPHRMGPMWRSDSALPRQTELQDGNMNIDHDDALRRPSAKTSARRRTTSNTTARATRPSASSIQQSRLVVPSLRAERKVDWQHLFKHRRRLEENWGAGRFTTFQLPHPDHPEEAHRECVYTIQHNGRYLVSGSRDKTIRVWDLDSQRLVKEPLYGHVGSVLCLQFDPSEDEDVIISGSSDTDVIVWRFSTGQQLKKIRQAHAESVLNLRFDKRYLVTCSKDKTINVWSRRQLEMTDGDFPAAAATAAAAGGGARHLVPQHVVNLAGHLSLFNEGRLASSIRPEPLPAYSLLMSLRGHNAAVNAIQVLGDQIVSASGDRTIKVWNVRDGHCEKTIPGHQKGIACVQYDGRRIVSGSSDNTVKIFDSSGAEIACLQGHQYLVRTVQAGFGDIPGSEDDDRAEARAIDKDFLEAYDGGRIPLEQGSRNGRNRTRNAGSRNPNDITAFGANLPPGGGGSRWGRIVSGSYDETIIVWKREADGKWVVGHRLRQEEAARAASARSRGQQQAQASDAAIAVAGVAGMQPVAQNLSHGGVVGSAAAGPSAVQQPPGAASAANPTMASPPSNAALFQMSINLQPNQWAHATQAQASQQQQQQQQHPQAAQSFPGPAHPYGAGAASVTSGPFAAAAAHHQQHQQTQLIPSAANLAGTTSAQVASGAATLAAAAAQTVQSTAAAASAAAATMTMQATAAIAATVGGIGPNAHQHHNNNNATPSPGNARVFKLQFDARRIVCCSQDPRIVGWDFANGDDAIIEASRFFQGL